MNDTHASGSAPDTEGRPETAGRAARGMPRALLGRLGSAGLFLWTAVPPVEQARKVTLDIVMLVGALVGVVVIATGSLKTSVVIDPIKTPKVLAELGLTDEVVAQRIHDEIVEISRAAKAKTAVGDAAIHSFDRSLQKVDFPVGGISVASVVASLRDTLGLFDTKISGELIADKEKSSAPQYSLRLRITDKGAVFRHEKPTADLDQLFRDAAIGVVERFDPEIAAQYYYARSDYPSALRMVDAVLSDPKRINEETLLLRGKIALQQKQYQAALWHFNDVLARYPKSAAALDDMASTLIQVGKYKEALEAAQQAIRLNPRYAPAHNSAGSALYSLGNFAEALTQFAKSTELDRSFATGYLNQAAVYRDRPVPDDAMAVNMYRHAADTDPRDERAFLNWGTLARDRGNPGVAQILFERAIAAKPESSRGRELLGRLYLDQQQWDKARELFLEAIKLDRASADLRYYLGLALQEGGKPGEAAEAFREAFEINEKFAMAYVKRAASLAQSAPTGAVIPEIQDLIARARKVDGTNEDVLREIGKVSEALARLRQ